MDFGLPIRLIDLIRRVFSLYLCFCNKIVARHVSEIERWSSEAGNEVHLADFRS